MFAILGRILENAKSTKRENVVTPTRRKIKGSNKKGNRNRSHSSGSSSSSKSKKSRKGGGKGKKGKRSPTPPAERKNVTCTFFIRHKCSKGDDCEFKHDSKEQEEYQKKMKKKKEDFQ